MPANISNNTHEKPSLSSRRRLLQWGIKGSILVVAGTINEACEDAFNKPSPSHTLYTYAGHPSGVSSLAWSPDGKYIASAATDKTVQVWSAINGANTFTYREHTDEVRTVSWSSDGTRIVSGGDNPLIRVWKV